MSGRPSNPHSDNNYCRIDYMVNGKWYFRKFTSKSKAAEWLVKACIQTYTMRDCGGGLLGG